MHIENLFMKGFKSFGKQTLINLSPGVNGIVGPNGSGKSNVFDSISFAMGEHGSSIRISKGKDLFYIGRGEKNCKVRMTLKNENPSEEGENEELIITRELRKDGTSKYYINNERVRRKDVYELFTQANIAPLYSVVSQGEIENIVRMSDYERRKIIDDIAGISEFEDKKEKALHELENVKQKLNQINAILSEKERSLKRLQKDRKAALNYLELEKQKKQIKTGIITKKIQEMQEAETDLKTKIIQTETRVKKLKQEIEETNKQKIQIENKLDDLEEKMKLAQGEELLVLVQQLEAKKSKIETEEKNIQSAERSIEFSNQRMLDLEESRLNLDKIQKLEKELKKVKKEKKEIEKIKQKYFGSDKQKYDTLKEELEQLRVEIGKKEEKEEMIQQELNKIMPRIQKVQKQNQKMQQEKKQARQKIQKLETQKTELTQDLERLRDYASTIVKKINQIKPKYAKKKKQLDALTAQGMRRLSTGVRQVLSASKANQLRGIIGLVADQFQCNKEHQTALEVAAGGYLTSIITRTDDHAAQAIQFLRQKRIGRVRFLPQNKIKPRLIPSDVKKLENHPGVIGFAKQLAQYDPQLEDIFKFIFGSTLVVADLDTAKRIGIGRARMVTLKGDLCETSGIMTGGHYKPMKSTGHLEKEVMNLEAELNELEEERSDAKDKIVEIRQTISDIDLEMEKHRNKAQMENLELELLQEREKELKQARSKINLKSLKKEFEELDKELKKIQPVKVEEIKNLDQRTEKVNQKESQLKIELNELKSDSKRVQEEIQGLKNKIEDKKKERKQALENIKKLNDEIQELEGKIKKAKKSTSSLYGKRDELEEKRVELEKEKLKKYQEFGQINEDLKNRRKSLIGIQHEIQEQQEELEEYEVEPDLSDNLEQKLEEARTKMESMGPVNLKAAEEYEELDEEVGETVEKKDKLRDEKKAVIRLIRNIEKNKKQSFMRIYDETAKHFKTIFSELQNGTARLRLEDPQDPFNGGMYIEARMHGKRIRLEAMSGGEKSLTALAFIFALQKHSPSPFYLLDEVDAALDKVNSEKLVQRLKKMGEKSQVLVITHNDQVLKACDQLIGVYMKNGISKIVSVKVDEIDEFTQE